MTYRITILRQDRGSSEKYLQSFIYEAASDQDTVASALTAINERMPLLDAEGNETRRIEWECSCLQRKCGACAMVIDGYPMLACDALLSECRGSEIRVEPLRKFPCIADLVVDRSIMADNLRTLRLWLNADPELAGVYRELAREGSECIQCGCCLEICPNFYAGGKFFGMSAVPLTMRLLSEQDKKDYKETAKLYAKHVFAGCGKSLACRDVCPRHIDTERMLVNSNALAVWKRKKKK